MKVAHIIIFLYTLVVGLRRVIFIATKTIIIVVFNTYRLLKYIINKYLHEQSKKQIEFLRRNRNLQKIYENTFNNHIPNTTFSPKNSQKSEINFQKSDNQINKAISKSYHSNEEKNKNEFNYDSEKIIKKPNLLKPLNYEFKDEEVKLDLSSLPEKSSLDILEDNSYISKRYTNKISTNSPINIVDQSSKKINKEERSDLIKKRELRSYTDISSSHYDNIIANLKRLNKCILESKIFIDNEEFRTRDFYKEDTKEIMLSYKTLFKFNYEIFEKKEPIFIFDLFNSIYPVFKYFKKAYQKNIAMYLIKRGVPIKLARKFVLNIKEYGELLNLEEIINLKEFYDPVSFFTEVELKTFKKFSPKIDSEVIKAFKNINYKKFIFTIGDLKIIKSVLFSLGLDNFINGIFYLDYTEKSIPTKKSIFLYEMIDIMVQNNKIFYFDSSVTNIKLAKERGWNVFPVDHIAFKNNMNSILKFIGFKLGTDK